MMHSNGHSTTENLVRMLDLSENSEAEVISRLSELRSSLIMLSQLSNDKIPDKPDQKISRIQFLNNQRILSNGEIIAILRTMLKHDVGMIEPVVCKMCGTEVVLKKYLEKNGINPGQYMSYITTACILKEDKLLQKNSMTHLGDNILCYLSEVDANEDTGTPKASFKDRRIFLGPIIIKSISTLEKNKDLNCELNEKNSEGIPRKDLNRMAVNPRLMLNNNTRTVLSQFSPSVIKQKVVVELNENPGGNRSLLKNQSRKRHLMF